MDLKKRVKIRNKCPREKLLFARQLRKNPTPAEALLWKKLQYEQLGVKFRRQSVIRGYIVDFYCPSLRFAIEVDGSVHDPANDYDRDRNILESTGIVTIRFRNIEVFQNMESVLRRLRILIALRSEWI